MEGLKAKCVIGNEKNGMVKNVMNVRKSCSVKIEIDSVRGAAMILISSNTSTQ
jgi:hypothetical protein